MKSYKIGRASRPLITNSILRMFCVLALLCFVGGCAPLAGNKSVFSLSYPPQYLYQSGLLKLEKTLHMPVGDGANTMYFSRSGKYLVTTGYRSAHLNIWDLENGENIVRLANFEKDEKGRKNRIFSFRGGGFFLPGDRTAIIRKTGAYKQQAHHSFISVDLKNPENRHMVLPDKIGPVNSLSPDGKYFVARGVTRIKGPMDTGEGAILKLYRTRNWSLVADVKYGYAGKVVAFSPDGKYVIDYERMGGEYHSREDSLKNPEKYEYPEIRFWSVPDLHLVKTIDNVSKGSASTTAYMAISPNNSFVAVGAISNGIYYFNKEDQERYGIAYRKRYALTKIFSINNGELIHRLDGVVGDLYFTHDSKYLIVTNGQDHMAVRIFSTRDWQLKEQVGFKDSHWSLDSAFNPEKNLLAFSNGNIVYIWKVVEK